MNTSPTTRRDFLKKSIAGGLGLAAGLRTATLGGTAFADDDVYTATVAITKGPDRADNAFRAMQLFKNQIATAIGNKRVVIKINFVSITNSWAYTRADHVNGILEFLKSIGKTDVVIAESPAGGNTIAGYDTLGYWSLAKKYPVKLMDLNQEGSANANIWQYGSLTDPNANVQKTIRICKMLLNPNNFIISATPLKTHNTVVVTMAGKNIGMGVPFIDYGFNWSQGNALKAKQWMHGHTNNPPGDYQCLNDNVYRMLAIFNIRPHLAVLDAYQGTEGNGPVSGSGIAKPQQLAVVSRDWLAADRVGLTLMGTNVYQVLNYTLDNHAMPYPAVLNYCWQAGLGEWDDRNIQVIGDIGSMTAEGLKASPSVYNYAASPTQSSQLGMRTTPREGTIVNQSKPSIS